MLLQATLAQPHLTALCCIAVGTSGRTGGRRPLIRTWRLTYTLPWYRSANDSLFPFLSWSALYPPGCHKEIIPIFRSEWVARCVILVCVLLLFIVPNLTHTCPRSRVSSVHYSFFFLSLSLLPCAPDYSMRCLYLIWHYTDSNTLYPTRLNLYIHIHSIAATPRSLSSPSGGQRQVPLT